MEVTRTEPAGAVATAGDTATVPADLELLWGPIDPHELMPPAQRNSRAADFLSSVANIPPAAPRLPDPGAATMHWAQVFGNQHLTWDDLAWLRDQTKLPFILKGVLNPRDAERGQACKRGDEEHCEGCAGPFC